METAEHWWAKGVGFENCNCRLLCHGAVSYNDECDYERCTGVLGFHIAGGEFGEVPIGDLNVVVYTDAPQLMIEGGWTQRIYIDERADERQREALEKIFSGQAGGGWGVLGNLISNRLETLFVPIEIVDEGGRKGIKIEGVMETEINAIRGIDKQGTVTLQNLRNQIFDSPISLAFGKTQFNHCGLQLTTDDSHAMYSEFHWKKR